jgi:alpha-N-arabinofuranosidase
VHHLGRETFLTPVTWSQDGWPIPGEEGFVALESPLTPPGAAPDVAPAFDGEVHDDFVMPRLNPEWNFLRNPHAADWSVGETPGWLRLTGSAVTLEDVDSPAWVGRRQQHFEFRAGTALRFDPIRDGEEAGLTVFMNERHHYVIALTRRDGARIALVRAVIGGIATELWQGPVGEGTIALAIAGDAHLYRFRWAASGETPATVATAPTRHLSTEVAGGFTGVYLAMYATGNGQPGATPAYFDHFTYSPFAE